MRNPPTSLLFALLACILLSACGGQGATVTSTSPAIPPTDPVSPLSPLATPFESPLPTSTAQVLFDGSQAMEYAHDQMRSGSRPTGSEAGRLTGDYIARRLEQFGWQVEEQPFEYLGTPARNIIATRGEGPLILLGAHYDTRRRADQDPIDPTQPVPGANDGASGVAVLLELARVLDVEATGHRVQLAFFDAEDNGGLDGWDWIAGSRYLADHLQENPAAMVLVDMIGDADQQIYWEANSDPALRERLWAIAAELGFGDYFVPQVKHALIDDHIPFLERGIPAVDIIDFDYPYWHTAGDTIDKVSAASMERVGRTLQAWLERGAP